jgi:methylmalonyl-CoA mutase N-terminal domain/subunit
VDPLGGSPYIEALTDELERRARAVLDEVARSGGAVASIESGRMQAAIDEAAYAQQQAIERGERVVVGVNRYAEERAGYSGPMFRLDAASEKRVRDSLARLRASRDAAAHRRALERLRAAAADAGADLMAPILEAVRADATVGEIAGELADVFGRHAPGGGRLER